MEKEEKTNRLHEIRRIYDTIIEEGQALSIKDLAVNGKDLIDIGVTPGPKLGEILSQLLEHVLEVPEDNNIDCLLKYTKELIQ